MKAQLVAIVCMLVLAACATPQERAEEMAAFISETYGPTCAKVGYQLGTDGHRDCMLKMYNADQIRYWTMYEAFPPPEPPRPRSKR